MPLRSCFALIAAYIRYEGNGKFSGMLAAPVQSSFDMAASVFGNVTVIVEEEVGILNPQTQLYDGCVGQAQRNLTDVMDNYLPFPVLIPGVQQGMVAKNPIKTAIVSSYNNTFASSKNDVMDAFKGFDRSLWFLNAFATAIITLVVYAVFRYQMLTIISVSTRKTRRGKQTKWQKVRRSMHQAAVVAIGNIMKQHTAYSYDSRSQYARIILWLFAVFNLLIHFYFSSMIKTEMAMKRPATISSYEEILADSSIKPLWLRQRVDHWDFMHAATDSPTARIWDRAKKIGIEKCLVTIGELHQEKENVLHRESVFFLESDFVIGVISNFCAHSRANDMNTDANAWFRSDATAPEILKGPILSSAMPQQQVKKYNHMIQTIFEHDLFNPVYKLSHFVLSPYTGSESVNDCVANIIIYPDHHIASPPLSHFARLFFISACCLIVCAYILLMELTWHAAACSLLTIPVLLS